jgi:hypothetical protein
LRRLPRIAASSRRLARFGRRQASRIAVQFDSTQISPFVAVNKDTLPHSPSERRWLHQINPPAKTSKGFSRQ